MRIWEQYKGIIKLGGIILLIPAVAWFLGFKGTYSLWKEYKMKEKDMIRLEQSQAGKESTVAVANASGEPVLNNGKILEMLSGEVKKNELKVVKYTPFVTREEGNMQLHTGELILSGKYISLLKLMDYLEQDKSMGKIVSASYRLHQDRAKKTKELRLVLLVQQMTIKK